jgi:peptidoglycan/xylan/chitin deacetylase (PgdA/CDA1 family)
MTVQPTPILMYHSIARGQPGPVSLDPAIFRAHIDVLAEAGGRGITVSEYFDAFRAHRPLPPRTFVLTFDDGYRDFADVAWPLVRARGWRATMFVCGDLVEAAKPWDCGDGCRRPLLDWRDVSALTREGVEFGGHGLTHADLTAIDRDAAVREIAGARARLEERAGAIVRGFATPYGRSTPAVREEIARRYEWSVGTRMSRAGDESDVFDLPRVEMWIFRNVSRWRAFVSRGWTPYFALRAAVRAVREAL